MFGNADWSTRIFWTGWSSFWSSYLVILFPYVFNKIDDSSRNKLTEVIERQNTCQMMFHSILHATEKDLWDIAPERKGKKFKSKLVSLKIKIDVCFQIWLTIQCVPNSMLSIETMKTRVKIDYIGDRLDNLVTIDGRQEKNC